MSVISNQGRYAHNPPKKRNRFLKVLQILLLLLFLLFGAMALIEKAQLSGGQKQFEALSEQVHQITLAPESPDESGKEDSVPASDDGSSIPDEDLQAQILALYQSLADENPDFYGWIQIDGTTVDYPVMYTPDNPEKYLHKDFYGKYSLLGTPFVDGRCTSDSDNLIIYGHNMNNGTMFKDLLQYEDKKYWEEHPIIHLNTPSELRDYEIMSVFYDRVYAPYETDFKYYEFIKADSESAYDEAVQHYLDKSLYDTGVTAHSGDRLITLSTCSYHMEDGRFVVVARALPKK